MRKDTIMQENMKFMIQKGEEYFEFNQYYIKGKTIFMLLFSSYVKIDEGLFFEYPNILFLSSFLQTVMQ